MKPEDLIKEYGELYHSIQALMEYLNIPMELRHRGKPHEIIIEWIKQPQTSYKAISEHYKKHMAENHPDIVSSNKDLLTDQVPSDV